MVARGKSEEEWKQLISDQKESGQSALAWCEENGVVRRQCKVPP